jgi:hypothetical protein
MNIKKSIGNAAAAVIPPVLFKRISTNPDNQNNPIGSNYLDMIYERDYKKIRHYRDYREMMQDPQVKVGLSILNMFFMSRELKITPAPDDQELLDAAKQSGIPTPNQEASDFIKDQLTQEMITPLRNVRKNIYTALPYGFSASECVYQLTPDGKIGIQGFYPIHRKTLDHKLAFEFDDNGNLEFLNQRYIIGVGDQIPIEKVLLYSFDSEFDDPHGNSMLDEIYDNVYIKRKVMKYLAIFAYKHATPTLMAAIENMALKNEAQTAMNDIGEGSTNITVGVNDKIGLLETQNKGEALFNMVQLHDNTIFKRMFIGTLMMGQMNDSGSLAQSQTQIEVTRMLLDGVHEEIAGAIQKKTDELTGWNFNNADPPTIGFEKFEDKDILALLSTLQPYVADMSLDADTHWFSELISLAAKEYAGLDIDPDSISEHTPDMFRITDAVTGTEADIPQDPEDKMKTELSSMMPSNQD